MIHQPPAACLTQTEAHRYLSSKAFFDLLVEKYGLKPVYRGKSGKTLLYPVHAIDTALRACQLNGGFDQDSGRPLADLTA